VNGACPSEALAKAGKIKMEDDIAMLQHYPFSTFNFQLKIASAKNLGAFIVADDGYRDLDIEFKIFGIEVSPAATVVFDSGIIVLQVFEQEIDQPFAYGHPPGQLFWRTGMFVFDQPV
jgi:hypothetical protein